MISFGVSWIIWIPVALTGKDYQASSILLLAVLLGVFGPGLAAIILSYRSKNQDEIKDFWHRMFDLRRIRVEWVGLILILWPILHGIAILITWILGGTIPESELLKNVLQDPLSIPVIIILYLIQAGVEELGWRGYLLEKIQWKFGASASSLIIGLIHAIWHLPLFWMVGTNQFKMGFGLDFILYIISVISLSVFSTWCYLGNGHSTLAITLLHTTGNLSFDIFAYAPGSLKHRILVLIIMFGAIILLAYFPKRGWGKDDPEEEQSK